MGSRTGQQEDHAPDNLIFEELRRPLVATVVTSTSPKFTTQRVRVSTITKFKEFSRRNEDEDRARGWISTVKSAFLRDQALESEKCLVFDDVLTEPAGIGTPNWADQHVSHGRCTGKFYGSVLRPRQVCMATRSDHVKYTRIHTLTHDPKTKSLSKTMDQSPTGWINAQIKKACTHCGSTKHNDRGCWKCLTCQKCGRKGHLSDKCFFVCAACGGMHEGGKCPMEEFYNMICQWYMPTKHAGMLSPKTEEMIN